MSVAIRLENVHVGYLVPRERIRSIKEYAIRKLKRRIFFDQFEALRGVSFEVGTGETLGIVGRNGAGKSTALRVIGRIIPPTGGRVVVAGRVAPILELGLGLHGELTGRENVMLQGALLGFSRTEMKRRLDRIVAFAELEDFVDAPLRTFSTGSDFSSSARRAWRSFAGKARRSCSSPTRRGWFRRPATARSGFTRGSSCGRAPPPRSPRRITSGP